MIEEAKAKARKSGKRVEIPERNTETVTLYANPDGRTLRMELSTQPIRVKNADGKGFTPIDTTLAEADGVIKPKATQGNLVLSAGQDKTLLRSRAADATAEIATPSVLPKPKLKGNTAIYPGAYGKGRDLLVTVNPTGFRQQITIAQRPTGPVSFKVPVNLPEGLSFKKNAAGKPTIVGKDGKTLTEVRPTLIQDAEAADANAAMGAGKVGKAAVTLDVDNKTLVFTPDATFLADPAVTYPVTMTAAASDWWEGHTGQSWLGDAMDTFVNNADYPESWDNFRLDRILVGKSNNGAVRWRGYLQFPDIPAEFAGSTVENADLILWNYYSNACGERVGSGITARQITSDWDELTLTWNNQPSVTNTGADTEYGAYSDYDCTGSMAYAWDLIHSVDDIVQAWVDGATNYGIQLTAGSESDVTNWRRYRTDEAGGCRTEPLQDCQGTLHPPILTVDFEPPAPLRRETVIITSREPLTSIPEYEEAVTRSIYAPKTPESIESLAMSEELAAATEEHRDGEGSFIGTDKLSPSVPYPGDGDDTGNSDGEDTAAPRVQATEPASEATEVPLDSQVRVTFTEEVGGTKIVVKSAQGAEIQGTTELDGTGRIATFTPAQPLRPGTEYTVEVSEAMDSWENVMLPSSWSFTTQRQAAGQWTFDEGDGRSAADSSGNDHDASLNETAGWITGKSGSALSNVPSQARVAASEAAVKRGKAVEVADETTATSITYAQPDGKTFKTEVTTGPVRTRQGSGWVPVDTTLAEQGGKLRPKALAEGAVVELSAGGTDPFVKMTADGTSYALRWPTPLPKPTIKGSVATYTDAAGAGADLVVTALPTGFRHEVVLRQRPSKPLELRIGVEDEGLTLSEGKGGRLLLKGKDKKLVVAGTRPMVSDGSARDLPAKRGKAGADVVTKNGRTELVLKPDQAFLADTDTAYPVRVASAVTLPLASDMEVTTFDTADSPALTDTAYLMAGTISGFIKSRVHLRFDTTGLQGSTVTGATLSMNTTDSHNCGPALANGIQVARLTSGWNPDNIYWANKPAFTTEDASTNFKGVNSDCAVYPDSMDWNVTGIVQDWAAGAANHGLVLKSPGEANINNYREFTSSEDTDFNLPPTLTITTSGPASAPAVGALAITPAQSVDGTVVATSLTPQLAAIVSDTAGGDLTGAFEIEHDPATTSQGTGQIWAGSSAAVASGGQATVSVPAGKLADGWKVRWRARAVNAGASTTSAWSDWQTATIDVPNPTVAAFQVTPSQVVDGATVATSLTPALRTTVTDPATQPLRAEFEVEHDPAAPSGQGSGQIWAGAVDNVASGTQASVTVPDGKLADGWKVRWRVRAVNTATTIGSPWSGWQNLTVDVPDPVSEPAVGALQVTPSEQVDGTTVTPTLTPALLAQISDPAGKPLRAEAEVEHDPTAPSGQGSGQIWAGSADNVPAGTQASITVPAGTLADGWKVRWRARAVSPTAASAWSDWQSFTVSLPKPTATDLAITPSRVVDGTTVTTTLTPTLQATLTHPAGQPLRAEAEIEHDPAAPEGQGSGQIWAGAVNDVASGTRASIPVPAGQLTDGWKVRWRLRVVAGDTSSGWSDWRQVTIDVTQPGEEPLAQTAGPVIRTDQSFTVAAWLRWSDKDGDYTVLEQRGTHQAPFHLGNTPNHGLVFTFTSADAADATVEGAVSEVEPPVGEWFHLAGVYDATAKTASLYLNGTLIKTALMTFATWNADTAITLGSKMRGDLDEVQIYQRPLSANDVADVMGSATAPAPLVGPASPKEAAAILAATQSGAFDYERLDLQKCQVSPSETGYAEYDARIRELPYNSCWSSYLYFQDYEEDPDDGRMRKANSRGSSSRTGGSWWQWVGKEILDDIRDYISDEWTEPFDDDDAFRLRATWVIHGYLGDKTGNGVVNGAGSSLKPTDMKVFFRLDEFAIVDDSEGGEVKIPASKLGGVPLGVGVSTAANGAGTCDNDDPDDMVVKEVPEWNSNPDHVFMVRASTSSTVICSFAPAVLIATDEGVMHLLLWSRKVLDQSGKAIGVLRHGSEDPYDTKWVPNFRCDRKIFGANDPDVEDRFGGCVNTRAKRVFVMSKSRDASFGEVIDHIEAALNPRNRGTWPPLRPGHNWSAPSYPPTRKILGNEQDKAIPGNWAAPRDDPAGKPLVRGEPGVINNQNREHFSRIPMYMDMGTPEEMQWLIPANNDRHKFSINYCKYYMPEKYPAPFREDKLPIGGPNSCDEYPFAATKQGAKFAEGNYSVRALNHAQNVAQGNRLNTFFADFRVGEGNKFWVLIEP
ncbi:DNRLRE domain-containing protein [Microbispora hainanensis]|uniref:DNRLRE domain-containing protein n=1 Tax=Microbispora hainanensis TaxID=568844 RepID=A0ABZ1SNX2_9ACTN|nr:DNRLRE domain-containing protein [Microbispora hainanensis]